MRKENIWCNLLAGRVRHMVGVPQAWVLGKKQSSAAPFRCWITFEQDESAGKPLKKLAADFLMRWGCCTVTPLIIGPTLISPITLS